MLTDTDFASELRSRWFELLNVVAVVSVLTTFLRNLLRPGRPVVGGDAAVFMHIGWMMAQGERIYVDIWDLKPPLAHETMMLVGFLGDPLAIYIASSLMMQALVVGIVALTGLLVFRLTWNETASLLSGLFVLAHPLFHYLPSTGPRVKLFAVFFGLLGLYLMEDQPLLATVAATLSPGYWQFGVVFTIIIVINNRDRIFETVLVATVVTLAVLAPMFEVFWPMISEVILTAVIAPQPAVSPLKQGARAFIFLGWLVPVLLLCCGIAVRRQAFELRYWWVSLGLALGTFQVVFLDLDSYPDLILLLVFCAMGLGIVYDAANWRSQEVLAASVAIVVVISVVWLGSFGVVTRPLGFEQNDDTLVRESLVTVGEELTGRSVTTPPTEREGMETRDSLGVPTPQAMFWNQTILDRCHYGTTYPEMQWIRATDTAHKDTNCGLNRTQVIRIMF